MTGEQDDRTAQNRAEFQEMVRRMADYSARFDGLDAAVREMQARLAAVEARLAASTIGGSGDGTEPARAEPGG